MPRLRSQRAKGVDPDAAHPRMLLVLDLDETLLHATQVFNSRPPDHVVFIELAHLARYLSHLSTQSNVRCIEKRGWRSASAC